MFVKKGQCILNLILYQRETGLKGKSTLKKTEVPNWQPNFQSIMIPAELQS